MIELIVNGRSVEVDDDPATPLLYVLRGTLGLNGAKYGWQNFFARLEKTLDRID